MQETPVRFLGQEDLLEKGRLPTPVFLGFPGGSAGKESPCKMSVSRQMDKEAGVHIHHGILLSH